MTAYVLKGRPLSPFYLIVNQFVDKTYKIAECLYQNLNQTKLMKHLKTKVKIISLYKYLLFIKMKACLQFILKLLNFTLNCDFKYILFY